MGRKIETDHLLDLNFAAFLPPSELETDEFPGLDDIDCIGII
jgi:hypothetical protein